MPPFNEVWSRIVERAGEAFHTISGLEFTYDIEGEALRTSRTDYLLTRTNFETAYAHVPYSGPGVLNYEVRGPAYVWAILHDSRIAQDDWEVPENR